MIAGFLSSVKSLLPSLLLSTPAQSKRNQERMKPLLSFKCSDSMKSGPCFTS